MSAQGEGASHGVPGPGEPGEPRPRSPVDETRELLEAIFDSSPAGLAVLVGAELRFARVNAAYRALMPDPDVDPIGRRFEEVTRIEDPLVIPALRRALETGEPVSSEDWAVAVGGRLRRLSFHIQRVSIGGAAILVTVWETTPLWEARQAAQDAADIAMRHAIELDATFDAVADGFVLCGPGGEILRMNDEARRLLRFDEQERRAPVAEKYALLHVTHPDGRALPYAESPIARALSGETVRGIHLRASRNDRTCWVIASAAPVRAPDGHITGAVLTFSDETPLHELEEARDDLVRMISHDLRTPLNAVYTQAHLIRRHPGDPARVEERARAIARSCERMSTMIQDLVEATLLEAGQLRIDRVSVDLRALLPELLDRLRGGLDVDRVRLEVAPDLPHVLADPHRLERIVVNLLSNALKYSPAQGEVVLEASHDDGRVAIAVSDRGVGIAPEDLPHVFERFFRARGARRPEGLGLGLYITRLLVEAHAGRIEVRSRLGRGSTFRVVLPAATLPPSPGTA
jgi:signal transduction histidine kinase